MPFTDRHERAANRMALHLWSASRGDEARLVLRSESSSHSEPPLSADGHLLPHQLGLDDEAPRLDDIECFLLHGRDAPEEQDRIIRKQWQWKSLQLIDSETRIVSLGAARLAWELVAKLPRSICYECAELFSHVLRANTSLGRSTLPHTRRPE